MSSTVSKPSDVSPAGPDAGVDAVIAELRAVGSAETGEFTLDPGEARRRMAQVRLPEPGLYLLELVQCAVCRGASCIEVEIEGSRLTLEFDGTPFSLAELTGIHGALFVGARAEDPLAQSRARLVVALSVVTAHARRLRLRSGSDDGEGGVSFSWGRDEDEELEADPDAPSGTRIEVDYDGPVPERERTLLHERARYAEVPLYLGGARLDNDLHLRDALAVTALEIPGRGEAGLEPRRPGGAVIFVKHGVAIAEHELTEVFPGFTAVVDVPALERDLSQWEIIRDETYEAVVAALRQAAAEMSTAHEIDELRDRQLQEAVADEVAELVRNYERGYTIRFWQGWIIVSAFGVALMGLAVWGLEVLFGWNKWGELLSYVICVPALLVIVAVKFIANHWIAESTERYAASFSSRYQEVFPWELERRAAVGRTLTLDSDNPRWHQLLCRHIEHLRG